MTTVYLAPTVGAFYQGFTTGGLPLNAGLVYSYIAGGTTNQATYTTSAGNVQNANPIVLDADGRTPSEVWLLAGQSYRFDVKDSLGNLIKTYDNILGINDPSAGPVNTQQALLSGSAATYTTPASAKQLKVRMKGGGGGGSGSGTTGPNNGGTGTNTSFNSIVANGGSPGINTSNDSIGGAGGTGGSGSASVRITGAPGQPSNFQIVSNTNGRVFGGPGGGQGAGKAAVTSAVAGIANSGGGGSGGGFASNAYADINTAYLGSGGGEGEYVEIIINSPAATYSYTVGTGGVAGSGGTSGNAGATGGSGFIYVDEFY